EQTFLDVGRQLAPIDRIQFRSDCLEYIDELHFQPAGRISFARVLASTNRILYRHKISPPPTFLFFFKAISTMEGVVRRIDPDYDWREDWGPRLKKLIEARYSAQAIIKKYSKVARDYDRLIAAYPDDLRGALGKIKDGKFEMEVRMPELRGYVTEIGAALNKVAVAVVIASVVFGLFFVGRGQGPGFLPSILRASVQVWWVVLALLIVVWYVRRR